MLDEALASVEAQSVHVESILVTDEGEGGPVVGTESWYGRVGCAVRSTSRRRRPVEARETEATTGCYRGQWRGELCCGIEPLD